MENLQNETTLNRWKSEENRLMHKSNLIGMWVAIITYCGGSSLGSFLGDYDYFLFSLPFHLFPIPFMLLSYWIETRTKSSYEITGYVIGITLSTSVALVVGLQKNEALIFFLIMSNIPVFVTFGLIVFWKPIHSFVFLLYSIFINVTCYLLLSVHALGYALNAWLLVFPIGVGAVFLLAFRYNFTKRNFMITQELNISNQQLTERNTEVMRQKEEIEAQRDDIERQKALIEYKNEEITESINYASRIQTAILPKLEEIQKSIPHSFVFYQPKDIVSGDFYWAEEAEQGNKTFIGVADCTGHGIPGSLMAMIGANILNQIVNELSIYQPNEILTELDTRIRNLLKQNEKGSELRDGMDITLLMMDKKEQAIYFASANRPVYIIQNKEFKEIKGDKIPIGSDVHRGEKVFTLHRIDLKGTKTSCYLFSDGITDQFDALDKEKYGSRRWRELIRTMTDTPFTQQEVKIQKTYFDWKGNHLQTDDVLVVGLEI